MAHSQCISQHFLDKIQLFRELSNQTVVLIVDLVRTDIRRSDPNFLH